MKKVILCLLLCGIPLCLFGQRAAGKLTISVNGSLGYSISPEYFYQYWAYGFGFGGEVQYHLTDNLGAAFSYTYEALPLNENNFFDEIDELLFALYPGCAVDLDGGDVGLHIFSLNMIRYLAEPSAPFSMYVTLGVGYYIYNLQEMRMNLTFLDGAAEEKKEINEQSQKSLGINGGAGIDFQLTNRFVLFAEADYHYTFVEFEDLDQGKKGYVNFITAKLGVRFRL